MTCGLSAENCRASARARSCQQCANDADGRNAGRGKKAPVPAYGLHAAQGGDRADAQDDQGAGNDSRVDGWTDLERSDRNRNSMVVIGAQAGPREPECVVGQRRDGEGAEPCKYETSALRPECWLNGHGGPHQQPDHNGKCEMQQQLCDLQNRRSPGQCGPTTLPAMPPAWCRWHWPCMPVCSRLNGGCEHEADRQRDGQDKIPRR